LIIVHLNGGRVQKFGNNLIKSKFYSGRNLEQFEVPGRLLSFGANHIPADKMITK